MKLYMKRPYEKPLTRIYYSSSDILSHFSAHVNFRQRVVRTSTKEQQRLLSSSNTPRFQHVHVGRYGIKPLEPSDSLFYEQQHYNRKLSKVIITHETVYTHKNTISLYVYI